MLFAFEDFKLEKVFAHHITRNPVSSCVIQKLGMKHDGNLKGALPKK